MRRLIAVIITVGLVASACANGDSDPVSEETPQAASATTEAASATTEAASATTEAVAATTEAASATTEAVAATTEAVSGADTSDGVVTEEDLTIFIAAAEVALAGTTQEGIVLGAPEIYIALAQISCARFSEGASLEEVVDGFKTDTATVSADYNQVIGAVLGAGISTICPEHADKI